MLTKKDKEKIIRLHEECSIYSPISDKLLFQKISKSLAKPFLKSDITKVIGIESRGFLLASSVAYILKAGLVTIRKKGNIYTPDPHIKKLHKIYTESFFDYSKQKKALEIEDNEYIINKKDRILIIDDWFATGQHAKAAIKLIKRIKRGRIIGFSFLLDSMDRKTKDQFKKYQLNPLIRYEPWK